MTWKIGIGSGGYVGSGNYEEGFARMKRHGYDCVDFGLMGTDAPCYRCSYEEMASQMTHIRTVAAANGITVSQIHGPWRWPPQDATPEDRAERFEKMSKAVWMAKFLGSPYMVVHPLTPDGAAAEPHPEETRAINLDFFTRLAAVGAEAGVTVCVENMPWPDAPLTHPKALVSLVRDIGSPYLKICLDTGHSAAVGIQPAQSVRDIGGELLACLHIHDNEGSRDFHWLPYTGVTDWTAFNAALHEVGYQGVISLETSVSGNIPADIREYHEIGLCMMAKKLAE